MMFHINECTMIYCDEGYCPESLLAGKKVKMRINESDFWESPETGLQILGWYPLYAVVLPFRGRGRFKSYQASEPEALGDMILIHAGPSKNHFLPEDNDFFQSSDAFLAYLKTEVFATEQEFKNNEMRRGL